ncbi:MAG: DegV family protein [Dehalococcoidia bacterium]|nr:DegV family protein [Dehalococcoidia bacterium]
MIKVVTDSTSDLPTAIAKQMDIEVIPIFLVWEGKSYRDGIDIQPDEFYPRLANSNVLPTTSQPSPDDFKALYERLSDGADGIVSIHISSKISGTCESALQAARSVSSRVPVEVVDSQLNTMGLGLAAMAAARLAKAGASLKEVVAEARTAITQIRMLGIFDTLKYVIAGGRIDRSVGKIASILNIKPLLTFRHGEVKLAGATRTYRKGMDKLADFVRKNLPVKEMAVVHSANQQAADDLLKKIGAIIPAQNIYVNQLGVSLGVHGGPGILLVALRLHNA